MEQVYNNSFLPSLEREHARYFIWKKGKEEREREVEGGGKPQQSENAVISWLGGG